MPKTLFQKIWDAHVVAQDPDSPAVLYIDLHLVHEVTSPQAFTGLRQRGIKARRPDRTFATMDHGIPTFSRDLPIVDDMVIKQIAMLEQNCRDNGIALYGIKESEGAAKQTATRQRMAPLARWPLASAPARSRWSSPPSACSSASPRRWKSR